MSKIITLEDDKIKEIQKKYKKIILAHGVFDLLHIGHLRYLKKAKSMGDCLIVSITNDINVNKGINRPFFNEKLRMEAISELECVDYVLISRASTSEKIILKIKPNIYVKGNDYKKPSLTQIKNYKIELKALKKVKCKFKIIDEINYSSSKLINSNFDKLNEDQKKILQKIILQNKFDFEKETKKKINESVLLIGDAIIDEFIFTQSLGKSRKNNIISTRFKKNENYDGGSLMIAKILAQYFNNITLLTHVNKKEIKYLRTNFKTLNFVNIENKQKGIVRKSRFVDEYNLTKIFQINENDNISFDPENEKKFINKINQLKNKFVHFVISDFGHGLITDKICKKINSIKNQKYINCQANSSNFGYNKFTKYTNSKILSCDEDEYRLSLNESSKKLGQVIKKNKNNFKNIKKMIITSGKQGSYSVEKNKVNFVKSLKINNMIDSIGCGDVYFSYLIIFEQLKKKIQFNNDEIMILCHLAASIHSKYFANSKLIDKKEYIKGLKSFSA